MENKKTMLKILEDAGKKVNKTYKQYENDFKIVTKKTDGNKEIKTTHTLNSKKQKEDFKKLYGLDFKIDAKTEKDVQFVIKTKLLNLLKKTARNNLKE
jgi:hypothetical protein